MGGQVRSKTTYRQHRVCAMAGKVLKSNSLHLTNFVANRKVSASNPPLTHTRGTLAVIPKTKN